MAGRAKENLPGGSLKYQFIYLKVRIYVVTVVTWFPSWQFFLTFVGHIFVPRVQCWTLPCCLVSSLHAPASLALLHWSTCTCTNHLHLHHLHLHHLQLHHLHLHHLHLHHLHSTVEWIRMGSLPGGVGWNSTQAYHCQIIKGVEPSCGALIRPSSPDGLLSAQRWYSPSAVAAESESRPNGSVCALGYVLGRMPRLGWTTHLL